MRLYSRNLGNTFSHICTEYGFGLIWMLFPNGYIYLEHLERNCVTHVDLGK